MLSKLKHVTEARCHRRQTGASSQPRRKRRTALVLPAVCLAMSQSCMRTCVSFSCVQTVCQAGIAEWHPGGSRSRWRAREQTYRGTKDAYVLVLARRVLLVPDTHAESFRSSRHPVLNVSRLNIQPLQVQNFSAAERRAGRLLGATPLVFARP